MSKKVIHRLFQVGECDIPPTPPEVLCPVKANLIEACDSDNTITLTSASTIFNKTVIIDENLVIGGKITNYNNSNVNGKILSGSTNGFELVNFPEIDTDNFYTTGATLFNNIISFDRNDMLSAYTVNLSSYDNTDELNSLSALTSQHAININALSGITSSNYASLITGGTYNNSTGIATFSNISGGTFSVSGFNLTDITFGDFIHSLTPVGSLNYNSEFVFADDTDGFNAKKITANDLKLDVIGSLSGVSGKTNSIDSDTLIIVDSADASKIKQINNLNYFNTYLKPKIDTTILSANTWTLSGNSIYNNNIGNVLIGTTANTNNFKIAFPNNKGITSNGDVYLLDGYFQEIRSTGSCYFPTIGFLGNGHGIFGGAIDVAFNYSNVGTHHWNSNGQIFYQNTETITDPKALTPKQYVDDLVATSTLTTVNDIGVVNNYTLQLTDNIVRSTAGQFIHVDVTVPSNSSVSFPIGHQIKLLRFNGASDGSTALYEGFVIIPASGVTLNAPSGLVTNGNKSVTLTKTAINTWTVEMDLFEKGTGFAVFGPTGSEFRVTGTIKTTGGVQALGIFDITNNVGIGLDYTNGIGLNKKAYYDNDQTLFLTTDRHIPDIGKVKSLISGATSGITNTYVTGGTHSNGTTIFTNNSGSTFTVSGYSTGDMILASGQTVSGIKIFLNGTLGLRNAGNTFTSLLLNNNTASRNYTLQDRSGVLADDTDLAGKMNIPSGTVNYLPKFATTTTITSSRIFDDGINIGLAATTTPSKDITIGNQSDKTLGIEQSSNILKGRDLSIEAGRTINFVTSTNFIALNQTVRGYSGIVGLPNGDILACVQGGDIYRQTGGAGNFVGIGETSRFWVRMCVAPNGNVYATTDGGDIYKQTGGVGAFVALGQTSRSWRGITARPNGDILACVQGGDIYRQTGGAGNFVALGEATRAWFGIACAPNGDIYATVINGSVYKQTGGVGAFVSLGIPSNWWQDVVASSNGDVYICWAGGSNGDVWKQPNGSSTFTPLLQNTAPFPNWGTLGAAQNGNIYGTGYAGGDLWVLYNNGAGTDNLDGGTLKLKSGTGKGTGASRVEFWTGDKLSSGTTMQTSSLKGVFDENGYFLMPSITNALISSEATGKVIITKEYLNSRVSGFTTGYTLTSSAITSTLGYTPLSAYTNTVVTGGTYNSSSGVATFSNNTGGTFTISGFFTNEDEITPNLLEVTNVGNTTTNNIILADKSHLRLELDVNSNPQTPTIIFRNANEVDGVLQATDITTPQIWEWPDNSGTIALTNDLTGFTTFDTYVTSGVYSAGTTLFTNNAGGTFSVTGFTTPFTGGTVNNIVANSLSATTYYNLPLDITTTGGTYSNGVITFTKNNGSTFNVSGLSTGYTLTSSAITSTLGYTPISAQTTNYWTDTGGDIVNNNTGKVRIKIASDKFVDYIEFGGRIFSQAVDLGVTSALPWDFNASEFVFKNSTVDALKIGGTTNISYKPFNIQGNDTTEVSALIIENTASVANEKVALDFKNSGFSTAQIKSKVLPFGNGGSLEGWVLNTGGTLVKGWELKEDNNFYANNIIATSLSATTYYNLPLNRGSFGVTVDGGGSVITSGIKGYITMPYNAIITGWDIIGNVSGSVSVDIWKNTTLPTSADTITGSETPYLSNQQINSNNNLISFNTDVFINDILAFNVISADTVSRINLIIKTIKT